MENWSNFYYHVNMYRKCVLLRFLGAWADALVFRFRLDIDAVATFKSNNIQVSGSKYCNLDRHNTGEMEPSHSGTAP
ncbi:hypothetical protein BGX28_006157 [Mortierella sp. GBA30]|nr:hypothetical protein BGX28_006157 [Mortierella sp. GBA30]